jgi:hypothetical protein
MYNDIIEKCDSMSHSAKLDVAGTGISIRPSSTMELTPLFQGRRAGSTEAKRGRAFLV